MDKAAWLQQTVRHPLSRRQEAYLPTLRLAFIALLAAALTRPSLGNAMEINCPEPSPPLWVRPPPGYGSGFVNGSASAQSPAHLPANALGVLFHTSAVPDATQFSIIESATGNVLPTRVNEMHALSTLPALHVVERFALQNERLYRIEPRQGFKAGSAYRIVSRHGRGAETHVRIDPAPIAPGSLDLRLRPDGTANREKLKFGRSCYADRRAVLTQGFAFDIAQRLQPYRHAILAFAVMKSGIPWQELPNEAGYNPDEPQLKDSWPHGGLGGMRYFALQTAYQGTTGQSRIGAVTGLLEVEDKLYETETLTLTLAPRAVEVADSLDFLGQALKGGPTDALVEVLEQLPVRHTDESLLEEPLDLGDGNRRTAALLSGFRTDQRQFSLRQVLLGLLTHPVPRVRGAAGAALVRVVIRGPYNARIVSTVAQALAATQHGSDPAARSEGAKNMVALRVFAGGAWDQDFFCERKPWRKWFDACLDQGLFKPSIIAFIGMLRQPQFANSVEAMTALVSLPSELLIPTLVEAGPYPGRREQLAFALELAGQRGWLADALAGKDIHAREVALQAKRIVSEQP
jgi:hypothetical protein